MIKRFLKATFGVLVIISTVIYIPAAWNVEPPVNVGIDLIVYSYFIGLVLQILGVSLLEATSTTKTTHSPTPADVGGVLASLVHMGFVGPIIEEMAFRIIPFVVGYSLGGPVAMVVGSSLVWAYLHKPGTYKGLVTHTPAAIPEALAVLAGYPLLAIAIHMIHNTVAVSVWWVLNWQRR